MAERSMSLIDVVRQCGDQDLLRQVFAQPGTESAKAHWRQVAGQPRRRFPKAAALMAEASGAAEPPSKGLGR